MFQLPVSASRSWQLEYVSEETVSGGWTSSSHWSENEQNPFLEPHILWKVLKDSLARLYKLIRMIILVSLLPAFMQVNLLVSRNVYCSVLLFGGTK